VPPKFSFETTWTSTIAAQVLAVGDFNGDGRDDLAAVAEAQPAATGVVVVHLFQQKPNGSLDAPVLIQFPDEMQVGSVVGLTATDLNEDGRSDLVLAQRKYAAIRYLVSQPGGGFAWRQDDWSDLGSEAPVHAADMDGDGHIDLVAHLQTTYPLAFTIHTAQVATYFGDGTGSFPRHASAVSGDFHPPTAVGQLDPDGRPDYLSAMHYADYRPRVRMNDGLGGLEDPFPLGTTFGEEIRGLVVADLTGDGKHDAVINTNTSPSKIVIYPQLANGSLDNTPTNFPAGGYSDTVRSADLNGDGWQDLLLLDTGSMVPHFFYHLSDAYGPGHPISYDFDVGSNPSQFIGRDLVVGDLNGDGVMDVAVATAQHGVWVTSGKLTPYNGPGGLPGAPTLQGLQVLPQDGSLRQVDITIGAPADDGGSAIIGYNVYSVPGDIVDADAGSPATVHRMAGLEDNKTYTFYARAINAAGQGPASPMSAPVVLGVPVDPDAAPVVSIYAGTLQEGDVGPYNNPLWASINKPAPPGGSSFRMSTSNGTAQAGLDYVQISQVLITIPEGATEVEIPSVVVLGDFLVEGEETLHIHFSDQQNVSLESLQYELIIHDYEYEGARISLGDVQVVEGNAGTTVVDIPIKLSQALPADVTFDFYTGDDLATAGMDYQALALTGLKIVAGQTSTVVKLTIFGDTQYEMDEWIYLGIYNVSGADPGWTNTAAIIVNDDEPPTLSLADVTVQEGNQGTTSVRFTATLSGTSPYHVIFSAMTVDGSATAGSDFVSKYFGTQVIQAGQLSTDIVIPLLPDTRLEPDETFSLRLEGPTIATIGDAIGTATILNDDVPNGIAVDDLSVGEGGIAQFSIRLSEPSAQLVSFDAWTSPGTAAPDVDFQSTQANALVIPAGQTVATFSVPTMQDGLVEDNETFVVNLSNVSGAIVTDAQGLGRIINNDAAVLSISDATPVLEGNSEPGAAQFEIKLSHPLPTAVTFDVYLPGEGTADGSDYGAYYKLGVRIDPGRTRVVYPVYVFGDIVAEPDETFQVKISGVKGALLGDDTGVGTIVNDDGAGVKAGRGSAKTAQRPSSRKPGH
ncbi:MAG: Calx-beta domain-containing protein, partial [Pseudomonas sp.]|nr:Calx-beta domain-containing protein [Pseudomonas sp.]